jgi:hypothetical protein
VSRAVVTLEDLMLLVVSADLWATEWLLIWLGLRTVRLEVAPTRVDALERCGVRVLLGRVLEVLMKGIMKETMAMEMATDLQTWEILGSVHTITICSNGTGDTTIFVAVDSMGIQQFL